MGEFAYISNIAIGGSLHPIFGHVSAWFVGGVIIASFLFAALRAGLGLSASGNWPRMMQQAAFGALTIVCASAPSLAAEEGEVGYRVLTTYEFIAVLSLFAPLIWLGRALHDFPIRRAAIALALVSGFFAGWNVSDVARNYNQELLFIRNKIESSNKANLLTILFINRPFRGASYIDRPMQLEFSYLINTVSHLAGAVAGVLPEVGLDDRRVTHVEQGETYDIYQQPDAVDSSKRSLTILYASTNSVMNDEQTLVVDFNEAAVSPPFKYPPLPTVRTSGGSNARSLFDINPSDYWQPGPAPQWLELTPPSGTPLDKVMFYAGPSAEGAADMPRDWYILKSDDGIHWVRIASQLGEVNWKAGEERPFQFPKPQTASHYLFVFTAGNGPTLKIFKIGY